MEPQQKYRIGTIGDIRLLGGLKYTHHSNSSYQNNTQPSVTLQKIIMLLCQFSNDSTFWEEIFTRKTISSICFSTICYFRLFSILGIWAGLSFRVCLRRSLVIQYVLDTFVT